MALYHFKKEVLNSNESNDSNTSRSFSHQSSHFTNSSNGGGFSSDSRDQFNCSNCQKRGGDISVMLNRVNLGEVLMKTISDEMKSISRENGQNCLRFGGS